MDKNSFSQPLQPRRFAAAASELASAAEATAEAAEAAPGASAVCRACKLKHTMLQFRFKNCTEFEGMVYNDGS
jgi:hypothetical protein